VFYARDMLKLLLDKTGSELHLIAFIDYRAISAGALIAYGHEAIYMAETASIGDIGVIFFKPGGEMEYAPEKIETVVRTLLVHAAEQRGWNRGLLLKMTARNQNLYRITLADGATDFVIEDDLAGFLAQHPDIDKDNPSR
jgi:membrane-bound ClpP family serine protease